ncbi:MAG: fibronectin type III-like domain-contianing protein, partial [Lachnospiraceae bacterium]|nr:fibronectin type III-like domain-contianing protein [Lachnospiraceae bacterium]
GRTYRYMQNEALYPFGYGLSYTEFSYGNLSLSTDRVTKKGVDIRLTVKNTGTVEGTETVQVYVKALPEDGAVNVPNAQLKGICKCRLKPEEEKEVCFHLPAEAFALYDEEARLLVHKGCCRIFVGGHGPDARSCKLTGTSVLEAVVSTEGFVLE